MEYEKIKKELLLDLDKLRAPEGYLIAGLSNYSWLYGRDSLISAWQMLEIEPEIAKNTLTILAKYQGKIIDDKSEEEPGKILHEFRFNQRDQLNFPRLKYPYFGSVDSTPLFAVVAEKYFEKTKDKDLILQIWKNIVSALEWISKYGDLDEDNFIEYERKNPHGLFHQGWRDNYEDHLKIIPPVAIVEAQGYAFAAFTAGVKLAGYLKKDEPQKDIWTKRAKALKTKFQNSFWWEKEQYFYLALDKNKKPKKSVSSNPGHLIFSGILSEDKIKKIAERLFKTDMITPFGIRTISTNDPSFDHLSYHLGSVWPHDNWLVYYGLKNNGFFKEADQIKQSLLAAYQALDCLPELYGVMNNKIILLSAGAKHYKEMPINDPKPNSIQAWAICGLLDMLFND